MPASAYRALIATDIDGTLLNSQGVIPPENLRAIAYAQEKDVAVAIASGRFPENVYVLLSDYGLRCPIIGTNGAQIVDAALHPLAAHFMDAPTATAVRQLLEAEGAQYFVFGPGYVCTARDGNVHHTELSQGSRLTDIGFHYLHGAQAAAACCREPVHKFFVCDNIPLPPLREKLRQIPGLTLTQSSIRNIEIMPAGVDKGRGLRDMAAQLGVPMACTMALGDEENDIAMLQAAAYGTAMGNASAAAKAAARLQTAGNNEGGWAQAVEAFVDQMTRDAAEACV